MGMHLPTERFSVITESWERCQGDSPQREEIEEIGMIPLAGRRRCFGPIRLRIQASMS